jgi:hypothetical protein
MSTGTNCRARDLPLPRRSDQKAQPFVEEPGDALASLRLDHHHGGEGVRQFVVERTMPEQEPIPRARKTSTPRRVLPWNRSKNLPHSATQCRNHRFWGLVPLHSGDPRVKEERLRRPLERAPSLDTSSNPRDPRRLSNAPRCARPCHFSNTAGWLASTETAQPKRPSGGWRVVGTESPPATCVSLRCPRAAGHPP